MIDTKAAKPTDLDPPPLRQTHGHGFEDGFDCDLGVLQYQPWIARSELGDQFGSGHGNKVAQFTVLAFD